MKKPDLVFLIFMALIVPLNASGSNSFLKKYQIEEFKLHLENGASDITGMDRSSLFFSKFIFQAEFKYSKKISFLFLGGLKYETGAASSSFNQRRYAPNTNIFYKHAFFQTSFKTPLNFEAGSLDHSNEKDTSQFVNYKTTSFGIRELLEYNYQNTNILLSATQAFPYNNELSDKIGSSNKRSRYFLEMLATKYQQRNHIFLAKVGHYAYQSLGSDIADNDRYFGNSVVGTNEFSRYQYTFSGWLAGANYKVVIQEIFYLVLDLQYIKNDFAPKYKNKGFGHSIQMGGVFWKQNMALKFTAFKNESDTAPSFYNDHFTKNNYKGENYSLLINSNEEFSTEISYTKRTPIKKHIFIGNEQNILITLRKTYDFL